MLRAIHLLLAFVAFGSFAIGLRLVFRAPNRASRPQNLLFASAGVSAIVNLLSLATRPLPGIVLEAFGLQVLVGSVVLFWWTALSIPRQKLGWVLGNYEDEGHSAGVVFRAGPFGYVRHPFYASYLMSYLGCTLLSTSVPSLLGLTWMTTLYALAAVLEERHLLEGPLGQKYRLYAEETGMFIPQLVRLPNKLRMRSASKPRSTQMGT